MDWIKRNYDQAALALVALALLVLSGLLIYNAMGFQSVFAGITGQVPQRNNVPPIDTGAIQRAADGLQKPGSWAMKADQGSLFVSDPYIAENGELINPAKNPTPIHPPVPNSWIIQNHLDILDPNVLTEDPDGDGFTNLDEWKGTKGDGTDASDPTDKTSHPPYWTKLRVAQYIKQPFRLLFAAWDGDPKKPDSLQFQINTLDVNQPSQFLKTGDLIAGTKFKIIKFESKSIHDPSTDSDEDASELTIQNTETNDTLVMVVNKTADSPDSYALFKYLWNNTQFQVKKGKQFVLLPEPTLRYILVDISDTEAVIQTPTGQQVKVPHVDQP